MQGTRVRWLLAVAMVAGLMLTSAVGGTAAGDPQPTPAPNTAAAASRSSESMHLFLKANGVKIEGDSSAPTKAGGGSIEVLAFQNTVVTPRDAGSGMATGRRQYQPLLIRKRIDKASPLLMRALTNNQVIEGTIQFFRPGAKGELEQYYTITITGGRIVDYSLSSDSDGTPTEEIKLTFQKITWTYTNGGVTHEDTWDSQR